MEAWSFVVGSSLMNSKTDMTAFIQQNKDLASYTSWLIGGPADYLALPQSKQELLDSVLWAQEKKIQIHILGGGSNVLISDQGIRGLVICLKKFSGLTKLVVTSDVVRFQALAGTSKSELLRVYIKAKRSPALFLAGLPGDVGGGVVMNAGVSENLIPKEFGEIVQWIEILDLKTLEFKKFLHDEIDWQYRHSYGWQEGIISEVGFEFHGAEIETILDQVKAVNKVRLTKQPLDKPSCGSVFINPVGYKAAQLIDQCGLKGYQIGDAQVSTKHANFIVNLGQATAQDTWKIILHVQKTVYEQTGIQLRTEVVRLGDWDDLI